MNTLYIQMYIRKVKLKLVKQNKRPTLRRERLIKKR